METAQAVTDRLLTWSKWFALAIGAPLTLGAIVLGSLGYHTYSDFTSTVSSVEQKTLDQINSAAAAKTRIRRESNKIRGRFRSAGMGGSLSKFMRIYCPQTLLN
jgi:hypothetical protein